MTRNNKQAQEKEVAQQHQQEIFAATRQSTGALYISPVQSIRLTQTESQRPDGGLIRQPRGACAPVDAGVERSPRAAQDLA